VLVRTLRCTHLQQGTYGRGFANSQSTCDNCDRYWKLEAPLLCHCCDFGQPGLYSVQQLRTGGSSSSSSSCAPGVQLRWDMVGNWSSVHDRDRVSAHVIKLASGNAPQCQTLCQ
jgi:hypothetical protein